MRVTLLSLLMLFAVQGSRPPDIPFRIHAIDGGASETAAVADVNRDGRLDIVSGEDWYEAPALDLAKTWIPHRFRELGFSNQYIDNFSDLIVDVDGDDYPDVVSVSWFAKRVAWWRNPGKAGGRLEAGADSRRIQRRVRDPRRHGQRRQGQRDRRPGERHRARPGMKSKNKAWVAHVVSGATYGHGIGAGDVNGDKRNDILTPRGWLEAPADPRAGNWTFHPDWESINVPATPAAGASKARRAARVSELGFMHVMDVNGDGRNDVVTASGHDYGVYWFEQGEGGKWTRRVIDSAWSQGHASTLVDLNGDGRLDLVTGKRFMAHNGSDPGEKEPLGIYWYEFRKGARRYRVDPPHHRLRRPHGRWHADPRRRHRSRRRPGSGVRRKERAVRRGESDEVGEALTSCD